MEHSDLVAYPGPLAWFPYEPAPISLGTCTAHAGRLGRPLSRAAKTALISRNCFLRRGAASRAWSGDQARRTFEYAKLDAEEHPVINPTLFRRAEVDVLLGDPTKAKQKLGWEAEISLEQMIDADLKRHANQFASQLPRSGSVATEPNRGRASGPVLGGPVLSIQSIHS
jgi:hypothetical protein